MRKVLLLTTFLTVACSLSVMGQTTSKANKENSEVNPILPYHLCADPTAVEYNGRLYVYGTNDQQELNTTGDKTKNTYGKITQLVCMSTADMVNWTFHGIIDVKKLAPWIATSWAPSIVSREEADGKTHFYLYYTNTASGIGVLTSTSPTGPWRDPLGKALIYWGTPGRGEQSNIIDPGVCIDDNGTGWLTFGGGDPNKSGSKLMPGNARIVKLGKDMISLDGKMIPIPAPFHFEANELNYINGKYVFSYSGGWSCNAADWSNYDGKGSYACPGNCSILAMTTDDPVNGPWKYTGEILKNPGTFGYPWGNNHIHLQKFGNNYYMIYHTQYLEEKFGISGGYRGIAINKANVSLPSVAINVTMNNEGPALIAENSPVANERIEAETMANCAGIDVIETKEYGCVVSNINSGDWTMIHNLRFTEEAKSVTLRLKGKGTMKITSGRLSGAPIAVAEFDNEKMKDITIDLSKAIPADKTYNTIYFAFYDIDESSSVQFDCYRFNPQTADELMAIKDIELDSNENNAKGITSTYNLAGQHVKADTKGIVIRNGQKILVK